MVLAIYHHTPSSQVSSQQANPLDLLDLYFLNFNYGIYSQFAYLNLIRIQGKKQNMHFIPSWEDDSILKLSLKNYWK